MKRRINVIMGGPSAEYEVSLKSGVEVLRYIDRNKWSARAVVIDKCKNLYYCDTESDAIPSLDEFTEPDKTPVMKGPFSPASGSEVWEKCDAAFLALHGSFGEDGVIQGYLETIGIPYTGSGIQASAVAMNKITSKYLFIQHGIAVPPFLIYGNGFPQNTAEEISRRCGFPCFVKCPQSGSSKLMGRASDLVELEALLREFTPYSSQILVEQSISGIEFTCGVLEDASGSPFALPPVEIRPKSVFFDYTAKYTTGASEEIVPAPQDAKLLELIRNTALSVHKIIGCRGISRTDMIYCDDTLFVLETNTLPGLTANSLIPKAYCAAGGTFTALIDLLIEHALRTGNKEKA